MFFVLHKLNLTADQKTQIKSIMAGEKSQYEALRTSVKANHTALATTPPTDPNYATLIQTEQANAMTRIKLRQRDLVGDIRQAHSAAAAGDPRHRRGGPAGARGTNGGLEGAALARDGAGFGIAPKVSAEPRRCRPS